MPKNILVVDDEELVRKATIRTLKSDDFEFVEADSAAEARDLVECFSFDLALVDVVMPNESGLSLVRSLLTDHPYMAVVMVTGVADREVVEVALELGAYGYVLKPLVPNQLVITVQNALTRQKLEQANRVYVAQLERMVADRVNALARSERRLENMAKVLRTTESRLDDMLDAASDAVFIADEDGRITHMNLAATELLGFEESALGQGGSAPFADHEAWDAVFEKLRTAGQLSNVQLPLKRRDGSVVDCQVLAVQRFIEDEPAGYVIVASDITGLKQVQSVLERTGELRALDYMTPSVVEEISKCAHYVGFNATSLARSFDDIRSVLELHSRLIGLKKTGAPAEELLRALEGGPDDVDADFVIDDFPAATDQILQAIDRISTSIAALKDLHGGAGAPLEDIDVNDVLAKTIAASKNRWRLVASVDQHLVATAPRVKGRRRQLSRAFLWMLRHCTTSLAEGSDRRFGVQAAIKVSTHRIDEVVEIRIGHDGSSVSRSVAAKLADPRGAPASGEDVPIDLQEARRVIVDEHGGSLRVELQEDVSTTFVARLPLA